VQDLSPITQKKGDHIDSFSGCLHVGGYYGGTGGIRKATIPDVHLGIYFGSD
jgi:hypothetical protein